MEEVKYKKQRRRRKKDVRFYRGGDRDREFEAKGVYEGREGSV